MFKFLESLPTSIKLLALALLIGLAGAAAPANAGPLVEGAKIAEEKAEKAQEWAKKSALPWIKETAVPASVGLAEKLRKAAVEALKKEGE